MANTAITDLTTERICLNPSEATIINGTLGADMPPGTVVVKASDVWVKGDSGTASHKLKIWGVVGYKKRVNQTTGALKLITDNYDVSEAEDKIAPIITQGICVAKCVDQGADVDAGHGMMISATAGALTAQDNAQIDHGSLAADLANGDTVCIVATGKFKGRIWGGVN